MGNYLDRKSDDDLAFLYQALFFIFVFESD
jgi:hypothetical protein